MFMRSILIQILKQKNFIVEMEALELFELSEIINSKGSEDGIIIYSYNNLDEQL
jgi:hypothetical protein